MKASFQTIIIVIFSLAFVVAVAVFSGLFSSGKSQSTTPQGVVKVWGIVPEEDMRRMVTDFNAGDLGYTIDYKEIPETSFAQSLIVALADDKQPDMVLVSSEIFSQFRNKFNIIPYTQYPERTYRDTNVDGATVFLTKEGVIALPLLVDPIVVFYNKDLLAGARLVTPPTTWQELVPLIPSFMKRDIKGNIVQSAIALGEGQNVLHSRDILSALFLQAGNKIVETDMKTGIQSATLNKQNAEEALLFFASFSDPASAQYSWNRSLLPSKEMFVSGKLAFYVGRASELFGIQEQNPNLNFDVMEFFQPNNTVRPVTFGSFLALGVLKSAPNKTAAVSALGAMSSDTFVDGLSKRLSLPPVKKSLLKAQQLDPYVSVFYRAALSSFSWADPNNKATETIFRDMITAITSGRTNSSGATNEANSNLQSYIR